MQELNANGENSMPKPFDLDSSIQCYYRLCVHFLRQKKIINASFHLLAITKQHINQGVLQKMKSMEIV